MSRSLTAHVLFRLPSLEYDADATQEKQVSESVIPIIEGKIRDAKCRPGGIPSPICYEGLRTQLTTAWIETKSKGLNVEKAKCSMLMGSVYVATLRRLGTQGEESRNARSETSRWGRWKRRRKGRGN
jgi:hypothetical protein